MKSLFAALTVVAFVAAPVLAQQVPASKPAAPVIVKETVPVAAKPAVEVAVKTLAPVAAAEEKEITLKGLLTKTEKIDEDGKVLVKYCITVEGTAIELPAPVKADDEAVINLDEFVDMEVTAVVNGTEKDAAIDKVKNVVSVTKVEELAPPALPVPSAAPAIEVPAPDAAPTAPVVPPVPAAPVIDPSSK